MPGTVLGPRDLAANKTFKKKQKQKNNFAITEFTVD